MPKVLIKRGTRAQLEAAKAASGLNAGELYLITDENKLAAGTAVNAYVEVQAQDGDLDAIAALSGTSGLLKKTAANTWALDTSTYLTSAAIGSTVQGYDADIPTVAASQAEMEAGSETAVRSMSPQRVKQAIAYQAEKKGMAVAMSIVFGG